MNPLLEQLKRRAAWLFEEREFKVTQDSYDPQTFGNAMVEVQSPAVTLRFISDRGQIFVEVLAPAEPGKWWNLNFLLEVIYGTHPDPTFELDGVVTILKSSLDDVIEGVRTKWARTKQELERQYQKRAHALRMGERTT